MPFTVCSFTHADHDAHATAAVTLTPLLWGLGWSYSLPKADTGSTCMSLVDFTPVHDRHMGRPDDRWASLEQMLHQNPLNPSAHMCVHAVHTWPHAAADFLSHS